MTTDEFAKECDRRLIDTHTLGQELGLRSRQALWARIERGQLPDPVFRGKNLVTLWDRDAIPQLAASK